MKIFYQVIPKYIHSDPVFWDTPSSRYCCQRNCAAGSEPI